MSASTSPAPLAADGVPDTRKAGNRGPASGFEWVSSSQSPAKVIELEGRFSDVVQIPAMVLEASSACWKEKALLTRTFHRWVPPKAFIREFRRAGVSDDIHSVCLAHRYYIFRFEDSGAKEMVAGQPWVVNGQPVATEDWRPEFVSAVDSVFLALLWVRLPSLPMEYWTDAVLKDILEPAGQFVCSDPAARALTRGRLLERVSELISGALSGLCQSSGGGFSLLAAVSIRASCRNIPQLWIDSPLWPLFSVVSVF